jgi:hypothetical protein
MTRHVNLFDPRQYSYTPKEFRRAKDASNTFIHHSTQRFLNKCREQLLKEGPGSYARFLSWCQEIGEDGAYRELYARALLSRRDNKKEQS